MIGPLRRSAAGALCALLASVTMARADDPDAAAPAGGSATAQPGEATAPAPAPPRPDAARAFDAPPAADTEPGWRQAGRDFHYVFSRPAHLDAAGWRRLGILVGTGISLYAIRHEARDFVLDHTNERFNKFLDRARTMGKLFTPLAVSLGYYLNGLATDSAYDRETSGMILENLGYAGIITGSMQFVIATERPDVGDGIRFFHSDGHSASGDVTIAASILAPVIERHLPVRDDDGAGTRFWKRFGTGALYGTAGLTALQRMARDKHWLPDVYFGYINGLMVGKTLVDSHRGGRGWREERRHRVDVAFSPSGISISWPADPPRGE